MLQSVVASIKNHLPFLEQSGTGMVRGAGRCGLITLGLLCVVDSRFGSVYAFHGHGR